MNLAKSLTKIFNKTTIWGRILIIITLILVGLSLFSVKREGFGNNGMFTYNESSNIYDEFYSNIYDMLSKSSSKNVYEIGEIIQQTNPNQTSIILDIGCGTGNHVSLLKEKGYTVIGVDNSKHMIQRAKEKYLDCNFKIADVLRNNIFYTNSFTHILCLNLTLYYMENKDVFFKNCLTWLKPGGYLVVHLVNRDLFYPNISSSKNAFLLNNSYEKKQRITYSKMKTNDFTYTSNFNLDRNTEIAKFREKFEFRDGNIKKQEHKLYMPTEKSIVDMAQSYGFIFQGKIDLMNVGYEYDKLYIFVKSN
jgi:SAM-dependent methyltransferase